LHRAFVHREVHHAPAELEQPLAWVTVAFVLLNRVQHCLISEAVLEFESGDRQTIDEQPEIERTTRLPISPESRARNLRRPMSLASSASALASFSKASGCVARRKAKSCRTSSA